MYMNKRILLGVDTSLSTPTQHALRITSELLEQSSQDVRLVLLHVIPVPYDTLLSWGKPIRVLRLLSPTPQQRLQAERALWRARTALQQQGIAPERIEWLQRIGMPADEIVKAARELGVDSIVIGSRGNALTQRIRRMLVGSTSRRVLRLASCPVTLVVPPHKPRARNLVAWYKEVVTNSLHEHPGSLLVFTACDVAQLFAPPKRTVGSKEVEAAARALEQLASDGLLCCHKVKGELRYFND
jgi:nucleotide-binding universal stress UspA family protein